MVDDGAQIGESGIGNAPELAHSAGHLLRQLQVSLAVPAEREIRVDLILGGLLPVADLGPGLNLVGLLYKEHASPVLRGLHELGPGSSIMNRP